MSWIKRMMSSDSLDSKRATSDCAGGRLLWNKLDCRRSVGSARVLPLGIKEGFCQRTGRHWGTLLVPSLTSIAHGTSVWHSMGSSARGGEW
jgi:hypothetical protein